MSLLPKGEKRILALHILWGAKETIYKLKGEKEIAFAENIIIKSIKINGKGTLECVFKKNMIVENYRLQYETFKNMLLIYSIC